VTEQRDDKEFEAFLAGESELVDRYTELGNEEPPPELDTKILAEARSAAKVRRLQFGPRGGWLKPVALAATVLLAFSLVMNIVIESPSRYEQVTTESAESITRPDSEFVAKELQALTEEKRTQFDLPVTGSPSTSLPSTIKEITVTARKSEFPADAEPVPPTRSGMLNMDSDAVLLIVAEYVAAAETGAARAEADAMEQQDLRKTEPARQEMPSSALAGRAQTSGNEHRPDDGSDYDDADDPELLLHAIERLHTSGESAEAVARLEEFLVRYPDHPVSIRIRQQDSRP